MEVASSVGLNGSITANLASTEGLGAAAGQTSTRGDASRKGSHWNGVAVGILEDFGGGDRTAGLGGSVESSASTASEGSGVARYASVRVEGVGAANLANTEGRCTTAGFALGDTARDDSQGRNGRDDSVIVDVQFGGCAAKISSRETSVTAAR